MPALKVSSVMVVPRWMFVLAVTMHAMHDFLLVCLLFVPFLLRSLTSVVMFEQSTVIRLGTGNMRRQPREFI